MQLHGSSFLIRLVSDTEIDQILQVYRGCEDFLALGPEPRASLKMVLVDMKHEEEEGGLFCGIFKLTGEMIGVIAFVPHFFLGIESQAFLSLLMITESERSKGIGREVVKLVEDYILCDPAVQTIASGVQANNPAAIRFWKSQGYEIVSGPHLLPDQTVAYDLQKVVRDK